MTTQFLLNKVVEPRATLILAHGSGQPMDSPFMTRMAALIASDDAFVVEVARFNFPYMERAAAEGRRRPPDPAARLEAAWMDAIDAMAGRRPNLFIGGKSLGGRIATMVADAADVTGVVCLGYPFHPPGKPERLRTAHLEHVATPVLILQGERDPFGSKDEVSGYDLSPRVRVEWLADGDHGFAPRKRSGVGHEDNLARAARRAVKFIAELVATRS